MLPSKRRTMQPKHVPVDRISRSRPPGRRTRVGLAVLLAAATWAHGHGNRNPPPGAAAAATDGGKIAFIDDASAVSVNPANLVEIPGRQVLQTLTVINGKAGYTSPSGAFTETEDPIKLLPNVFAAWPCLDGRITAGIGLTTPYGQSTEWDPSTDFPYFAELRMIALVPAAAVRLSDTLSFGAGLDLYGAELTVRQSVFWSRSTGHPTHENGHTQIFGQGYAFGANAGLTWQVTPRQRLALTYQSAFDMDIEGNMKVHRLPLGGLAVLNMKLDLESEMRFPNMVVLGYGCQATDRLRLAADVEWIEFSRFEELPLDTTFLTVVDEPVPPPPVLAQDWDDVWTAGCSASWRHSDALTLRASYKYFETPIPDGTFSPVLPDADKHLVIVGLGWRHGRHMLDLSYAYTFFDERKIAGNEVQAYDGRYNMHSEILELSYRLDF